MKYKVGGIVLLKDDGETEYKIASTRESGKDSRFILEHGFDYFVTMVKIKKPYGIYSRQVFEENVHVKQIV